MAKLTLQIVGNNTDAIKKVEAVKAKLAEIGKSPIQIKVDATGIEAIEKSVITYTNAQAKLTAAQAKLKAAENALSIEREKTAQARARQAEAEAKYAAQMEKTATAEERARAENLKLSQQIEKTNTVMQQTALQEEKTRTAAENRAAADARARAAAENRAAAEERVKIAIENRAAAEARAAAFSGGGNAGGGGGSTGNARVPAENALVTQEQVRTLTQYAEAQGRTGEAARVASDGIRGASSAVRDNTVATAENAREQTILDDIIKNAKWYLISGAVAGVTRAFKQAISTMKEVDAQLTVIQKVTNRTSAEMKALGESAYDVASQYGVTAPEFLESVGRFARAGYGDAAEAMAELATKTQLVGDMTAETADKFLLSVDAAWKYNHSITDLQHALDAANAIENHYAVTLEDLATAMPIVASVAANAGMSLEETLAIIGTIEADTKASASSVAYAVRALILNLVGAVGEYEDGLAVTEETVATLDGVMNKYAASALKAADAAGEVVNPLEAIVALSKAMDDNALTDKQMFELLGELGGKLRTNQLTAAVKDIEQITSQIQTAADSFGSADQELEVMKSSWERKLAVLQNTWTQFVSHIVDTDLVKGAIDVLTGFLNVLDNEVVQFGLTALSIVGTLKLIETTIVALSHTRLGTQVSMFLNTLASEAGGLTVAMETASAAFWASPFAIAAAVAVGVYVIAKAVDAVTVSYEEQVEVVRELTDAYEQQFGKGSEYEKLKSNVESLTEADRERLRVLEAQNAAMKWQIEHEQREANKKYIQENFAQPGWGEGEGPLYTRTWPIPKGFLDYGNTKRDFTRAKEEYEENSKGAEELARAVADLDEKLAESAITQEEYDESLKNLGQQYPEAAAAAQKYKDSLSGLIASGKETYDTLKEIEKNTPDELTEYAVKFIALYEEMVEAFGDFTKTEEENAKAGEALAKAQKALNDAFQNSQKYDELKKKLDPLTAAYRELADQGHLTENTVNELTEAFPELRSEIQRTGDGIFTISGDILGEYIDKTITAADGTRKLSEEAMSLKAAVEYLSDNVKPGLQALSAAFDDVQKNGGISLDTFKQLGEAFKKVSGADEYINRLAKIDGNSAELTETLSGLAAALFSNEEATRAVAGSTQEIITAFLKENGVVNAEEAAITLLTGAKLRLNAESGDFISILNAGAAAAENEGDAAIWAAMQVQALALQESIASGQPIDTSGAIASLSGLQAQSMYTAAALAALIQVFQQLESFDSNLSALAAKAATATEKEAINLEKRAVRVLTERDDYLKNIDANTKKALADMIDKTFSESLKIGGASASKGGGGGGGKTPAEKRLDALKSELALLEKQYDYNKELGASKEELFAIIDKIDAKELEIAQHIQNTNAGYESNAEILADLLDIERERYDWGQKRKALIEAEYEAQRDALQKQIQFLEASGGSEEKRIDLIRQQKDSLHQQAEELRALGATEDDLFGIRTEWWELDQKEKALLDEIIQKEKQRYSDAVSGEKDRLEFLEASGQSQQAQIDQMRTIQAALHEQAEYLRSIGAEQSEINALSKEWWDWQNKILAKEKEIAEALEQEIQAKYDAIVEKVRGLAGVQSQALSLLKEYGAGTDVILAKYGDYLDAQVQELEYLRDTDASLADRLSLAESWIKLKKEAVAYEKEATDDSAERAAKEKEENDYLSAVVSMRKSELSLIKARGDGEAAQADKLREIQDALRREAEYLTSTLSSAEDVNAVQEKINALAVEWYGYERDILEIEKELAALKDAWNEERGKYLSDVVSMRESELSLLKALGAADNALIAKDREIEAAVLDRGRFLEQQLEAMKASGAAGEVLADAQRELNSLAEKYLGLEQDILKIQQERLDAIKDETDAWLDEMEDAMRSPLEEQLALLEEQWNARKEARTEEEKLLAVEKARIALENAQRQRTVRTYNAATGQWEWIANQKTVQSALDALDKANQDLNEYYAQKDYERAVAALELQIDYTEKAFDALRESLDYVAKKIKAGEMTYKEAYAYIQNKMKSIYDRYGVELRKVMDGSEKVFEDFTRDMNGVMHEAVSRFEGVSGEINATWRYLESVRDNLGNSAVSFGKIYTALDESAYHLQEAADALGLAAAGFGSANSAVQRIAAELENSADDIGELPEVIQELLDQVTSTAGKGAAAGVTDTGAYDYRQETSDLMRENALGWWASTGAERSAYANANQSIGNQAGYNYESSSGTWTDSSGGAAFAPLSQAEIDAAVIAKMQQNSAAWHTASEAERQSLANENYQLGTQRGWWRGADGYWYDANNQRVYDSGGVLRGTGGVKATARDEMVLGPDLTEKTLEPETLRGFGEFADSLETVADAAGDGRLAETHPVSAEGVDFFAGAEQTRRSFPGVVFGGSSSPGLSFRSTGNQSIGTQHNGDVININGLDVSSYVSRGTTIGELASLSRNLGIRS